MEIIRGSRGLLPSGHLLENVITGVPYEVLQYSQKYGWIIVDGAGKRILISKTVYYSHHFGVKQ